MGLFQSGCEMPLPTYFRLYASPSSVGLIIGHFVYKIDRLCLQPISDCTSQNHSLVCSSVGLFIYRPFHFVKDACSLFQTVRRLSPKTECLPHLWDYFGHFLPSSCKMPAYFRLYVSGVLVSYQRTDASNNTYCTLEGIYRPERP